MQEIDISGTAAFVKVREGLGALYEASVAPARALVGLSWALATRNTSVRKEHRMVMESPSTCVVDGLLSKQVRHSVLRAFSSSVLTHTSPAFARQVRASGSPCGGARDCPGVVLALWLLTSSADPAAFVPTHRLSPR
jgi:hypothetical protein